MKIRHKLSLTLPLISTIALAAFLVSIPSAAFAVTSAEKQAEADSAYAQLSQMTADLETASDDYYNALAEHDAAVQAMNDAQARIEESQAQKTAIQSHLSERARSMYRSGSTSFLDVMFGASNFEDFVSTWDFLNDMNSSDAQCVAQTRQLEAQEQAAHDEYARQEQVAAQKIEESETIKSQAETTVAEQQALVAGLDSEVAALVSQEQAAATGAAATADAVVVTQPTNADGTVTATDAAGNTTTSDDNGAANGGNATTDSGNTNSGSTDSGSSSSSSRGDGDYSSVLSAAESRLGCAYDWGASGPDSFDCSGFVMWCYAKIGISLDHSSGSQGFVGPTYPVSEAQPGDILWMSGHVGIYVGNGVSIEAMDYGYGVCYGNAYRFDHATHP